MKDLDYLLFTGLQYYPREAWRDFVGVFPTKESALEVAAAMPDDWYQVVHFPSLALVSQGQCRDLRPERKE